MKKIIISAFLAAASLCFCTLASAADSVGVIDGRLANILEPINDNEAATKKYVDDSIAMIPEVPVILQTLGQSTTAVMSQKATTDATLTAQTVFNMIYPVGSIYLSVNNVNPMMLFGGEWVNWSSGRVPVGVDISQTEFNTVEKTGGTKTHTLNTNEMPGHTHTIKAGYGDIDNSLSDSYRFQRWGGSGNGWKSGDLGAGSAGGGQPHNNLQPYITCYMWKRTA